jgi:two-component system NtrC family sensor kinase
MINLTGLRSRILFTVGVSTAAIMMLLSWGMLYNWRETLLAEEKANALAVSGAFSVAVIDALIFADQDLYQSEGFLDNYVVMFMAQNPRLKAITILDQNGHTAARSWDSQDAPWVSGDLAALLATEVVHTTRTQRPDGQWVLETVYPMRTGNRSWGVLVLAIEAGSIRAQIKRNFALLALFTSSVTSLLLLLLWFLLGHLLSSLKTLVTAMDSVDFNDMTGPPLPARRDEIGILYEHFHTMKERVDQSRKDMLSAQHQVWHAERLAAIGRLASGLAHEINNPINGVRNCIYAIRGDLDNKEQTTKYLELMDEGLTNASGVINKLLGFARKQQTDPGPLNLNDAVRAVQRLVEFNLTRKGIGLELELDPQLPEVVADRQLMQEVVMNLVLNAIDAGGKNGLIRITSSPRKDQVVLMVQDFGSGIEPAVLDQVFDPFFTTKKTGEGTGLGLSICLSIVQATGGTLVASSTADAGTCFTISLPVLAMTASLPEPQSE